MGIFASIIQFDCGCKYSHIFFREQHPHNEEEISLLMSIFTMQKLIFCTLMLVFLYFPLIQICYCNIIFKVYKRKTEAAKKEYLKALAAYRASLVSKVSKTNIPKCILVPWYMYMCGMYLQ